MIHPGEPQTRGNANARADSPGVVDPLVKSCLLHACLRLPCSTIFADIILGHGVLPQTPPDNVKRLVDFVHEYPIPGSRP
jgi:hypothetical protein